MKKGFTLVELLAVIVILAVILVIADSYQIIPCPAIIINGIGVTSVVLPEGLKKIGYMSFAGNDLTEITIPSSVTYIGDRAFVNNQISNINFSTTPLKAECNAFDGNPITESEYTYPDNVTISCGVST